MSLTVLVPAHNEGTPPGSQPGGKSQIGETLRSLRAQTVHPHRIVVVADNCDDDTEVLALEAGAEVFKTTGNRHRKAGALNQWLDCHLGDLDDEDLVMVMDADSVLNPDFLERAMGYVNRGYNAVGGVFLGKADPPGLGWVQKWCTSLQRNEYARYARDIERKRGRTLVLTGTATVFTVKCLRDVVAGRSDGRLPVTGAEAPSVYDTKSLTEDNELTYALIHLGYRILAPRECGLLTEVMPTWGELARQRYRWKRGAVENNSHYGFTTKTAKYWLLQWWGMLGIAATALYLTALVTAIATQSVRLHILWIAVTAVYVMERTVTVRSRGWRQMVLAAVLLAEMPYDLLLQVVQVRALLGAILRTKKEW